MLLTTTVQRLEFLQAAVVLVGAMERQHGACRGAVPKAAGLLAAVIEKLAEGSGCAAKRLAAWSAPLLAAADLAKQLCESR